MLLPCQAEHPREKTVICLPASEIAGREHGTSMDRCEKCQGKNQEIINALAADALLVGLVTPSEKLRQRGFDKKKAAQQLLTYLKNTDAVTAKNKLRCAIMQAARRKVNGDTLMQIAEELNL